eukprot:g3683.t1
MALLLRAARCRTALGVRGVSSSSVRLGGMPPFLHMPPPPPPEFEPDGTPKKYPLHQPVWDHGYDWEHWTLMPAGIFHTANRERERQENTNPVTRYLDRRRTERGGTWIAQYNLPWHPYWVWMRSSCLSRTRLGIGCAGGIPRAQPVAVLREHGLKQRTLKRWTCLRGPVEQFELSSQMEELRATMRNVQEDSERSSDEARQCEAEAALDLSQLAALSLGQPLLVAIDHDRVVVKDQLQTLREQIQRSKQQQVEHRRAERELRVEMDRAKATFQETKMLEIDRLEQANTWARSEVFASGTRWRQQLLWRQQQIRMGRKGAVTTEHTSQEAETLRLMGFCLGALEDDCEEPTTSGKVSGKRLRNDHG